MQGVAMVRICRGVRRFETSFARMAKRIWCNPVRIQYLPRRDRPQWVAFSRAAKGGNGPSPSMDGEYPPLEGADCSKRNLLELQVF
jgi:hypothetical protein